MNRYSRMSLQFSATKRHPLARQEKFVAAGILWKSGGSLDQSISSLRSFIEEAFADAGLRMPPATVVSGSSYLRNSLLAAGPFLTILPAALLRYPRPHPTLTALGRSLADNQTTGRAAMAKASNHKPNRADILHHCPRGGEANAFERHLAVTAGHRVPIGEVRFVVAALNAFSDSQKK